MIDAVANLKAHARTARDVMAERVVSVAPGAMLRAILREVAEVLSSRQIHRLRSSPLARLSAS